jgi:hypothetical protein
MDFSSLSNGSIDYSPYHPQKQHTIVLCEEELTECQDHRFERFWRVWYTERHMYAQNLQHLTIVLRPSYATGRVVTEGIQKFLNFFYDRLLFRTIREGLSIYMDKTACDNNGTRYTEIADAPNVVYEYIMPARSPQLRPAAGPV